MLTDEQILPVIYYWAKRLSNRTHSFDELTNEAYIACKKLRSPLLLQKWVKWTMIHFRQHNHNHNPSEIDLPDNSFDFKEFSDIQEELRGVVDSVCNDDDKQLIYLIFWQNLTYRQVAKELHISFQAVFFRVKKLLNKLKLEYERKAKK